MRNGSGAILNGTGIQLRAAGPNQTVFADGDRDDMRGEQGRDWFFANLGNDDNVKDLQSNELLDLLFVSP